MRLRRCVPTSKGLQASSAAYSIAVAVSCTVLCSLASCRRSEPSATREILRPLSDADPSAIEATAVAGVWRPSVRLSFDAHGIARLPLGRLSEGTVATDLGGPSPGSSGAAAVIRLRSGGVPSDPRCDPQWPDSARPWRSCRLPVREAEEPTEIEVERDPALTETWFLSSPRFVRSGRPTKPPIFVILIDTVRADSLLTTGRDGGSNEGLAPLVHEGITFENARAPSSWTRTSVATLLTGLPPYRHRVYGRLDKLGRERTTLAEVLADNGYGNLAWSTNPNILPVWGFGQGFDRFANVRRATRSKPDASVVFDRVKKAVQRNGDDPYFYYIHLMDAHFPLQPKKEDLARIRGSAALRRATDGARKAYTDYLAEILGMEEQIGQFLAFLKARLLYDESLILVVADHGQEFLEHGAYGHGRTLYEEVLRIPMLLKLPGDRRGRARRKDRARLVDVMPTILQSVGVAVPSEETGQPLVTDERVRPVAPHTASVATLDLDGNVFDSILKDGWKLIVDGHDGTEQLFDLPEDPGEKRNLVDAEPERAERLRHLLRSRIRRDRAGWHLRGCAGENGATLRFRLRNVGTVQTFDFEPDDRIAKLARGGERDFDVAMQLRSRLGSPASRRRAATLLSVTENPGLQKMLRALLAPEHDEVTLKAGAAATVESWEGKPLRYRLGRHNDLRTGSRLRLSEAQQSATLLDTRRPTCAAHEAAPYLHLWYVPPPETVAR